MNDTDDSTLIMDLDDLWVTDEDVFDRSRVLRRNIVPLESGRCRAYAHTSGSRRLWLLDLILELQFRTDKQR